MCCVPSTNTSSFVKISSRIFKKEIRTEQRMIFHKTWTAAECLTSSNCFAHFQYPELQAVMAEMKRVRKKRKKKKKKKKKKNTTRSLGLEETMIYSHIPISLAAQKENEMQQILLLRNTLLAPGWCTRNVRWG